MSGRVRRQQIITELLEAQPVPSQEDLRNLLADRGISVTQATLSRDLREIGAMKTLRGYQLAATNGHSRASGQSGPGPTSLVRTLASFVTSIDTAQNLVVLRTGPGHAQLVALEIDRGGLRGVVGCLAGDDTVFLAIDSADRAEELATELRGFADLSASGLAT